VLTTGSWNTFVIQHAPAYALEGVIPVHCIQEGEDKQLLIAELVGASWTGMLETPIQRIAVELYLYKTINMMSDVEIYIECYRELAG